MISIDEFSQREQEVIKLLLQGQGNKQIAFALGITISTVEFHLRNIYGKLQVTSRVEAAIRLSEIQQKKPTASRELRQTTGENFVQTGYSSQAKHFYSPQEEKAMKNRVAGAILLSVIAIFIALGTLIYLNGKNTVIARAATENVPKNTPTEVVSQILRIPPENSTRNFDEVLLVLRSKDVPFTYTFIMATEACFIGASTPCGFTEKYPFPEDASLFGNIISWFPDGENGLVDYGGAILILNYQQRKTQLYKSDFLKTNSGLHPSPDMQWLIESRENDDPYLSDLVLIKIQNGQMENLDILPDCFKDPIGWMSTTKFLFRCDKSAGATSKKNRVHAEMFTIDIATRQVESFEPQYDWLNSTAVLSISPDGKSIVIVTTSAGKSTTMIKDFSNGQTYFLDVQPSLAQWTQDSSKLAIYDETGNIYIANRDGSNLNKVFHIDPNPGFADWSWLPGGNALLVSQYTDQNANETGLLSISINGEIKPINEIPTTFGYVVCGISPLPKLIR
jgi:DNA-binding CsgD family transcriptional regulator